MFSENYQQKPGWYERKKSINSKNTTLNPGYIKKMGKRGLGGENQKPKLISAGGAKKWLTYTTMTKKREKKSSP